MHDWSSDWPYFADVENAAYEIGQFCRRWGRIQVTQTKEKVGCTRAYCSFGCRDLHSLFYPGYAFVCWPRWLYRFLGKRLHYALMTLPVFGFLNTPIYHWQKLIYRLAYKRAIKKYPHIRTEILVDADYPEFLSDLLDYSKYWTEA